LAENLPFYGQTPLGPTRGFLGLVPVGAVRSTPGRLASWLLDPNKYRSPLD
jgi:hypothetical protein